MTDTWEVIQDALTTASISGVPLIVGAGAVPAGLSARWASLGQPLTVDPQGRVLPEPEDFEVSLWLPTNADEAVARYREITNSMTSLIGTLFASDRVSRVEIVEDGYDDEVTTPDLKAGVIVRTIQVTVQP